jgi:hypothetical protein
MSVPTTTSDTGKKQVSIKFLFKNEVEHTYVIEVENGNLKTLQDFIIQAAKNEWMLIPDKDKAGRFCLVKTDEVVCMQTTL